MRQKRPIPLGLEKESTLQREEEVRQRTGGEMERRARELERVGRGNGPYPGTSAGANPTKAPGCEIGRGSFSKENKDKVEKGEMNAGDTLSKCPF